MIGINVITFCQIMELFINVVMETHTWVVLEETLVPIVLRSVYLSMDVCQNEDSVFYGWSSGSCPQVSFDVLTDSPVDKELLLSSSSCFTLPTSCQLLCVILEAAIQFQHAATVSEPVEENGRFAVNFVSRLLWELFSMIERMLLYGPEHRSCAVGFLLPILGKSLSSNSIFRVTVSGKEQAISW